MVNGLGRNGACLDSGYGTGVKTAAASATVGESPVRRRRVPGESL